MEAISNGYTLRMYSTIIDVNGEKLRSKILSNKYSAPSNTGLLLNYTSRCFVPLSRMILNTRTFQTLIISRQKRLEKNENEHVQQAIMTQKIYFRVCCYIRELQLKIGILEKHEINFHYFNNQKYCSALTLLCI